MTTIFRSIQAVWKLVGSALLVVAVVMLSAYGMWIDAGFRTEAPSWEEQPWELSTHIAAEALGMITLSQPTPTPQNGPFVLARLLAIVLVGLAGWVTVQAVARAGEHRMTRRVIARAAENNELVAVVGLGQIGAQLLEDITPTSLRKSTGRAGPARPSEETPRSVVALDLDAAALDRPAAAHRRVLAEAGDARDPETCRRAFLDRATRVFVTTGDDVVNLDVAARLVEQQVDNASAMHSPPEAGDEVRQRVYVHVGDPLLARSVQQGGMLPSRGPVRVHVFNVFERAAHQILATLHGPTYAPRPRDGQDEVAHYVVFGFGDVAAAVVEALGRLAHFPGGLRPRITVLHGPEHAQAAARFRVHHPGFAADGVSFEPDRVPPDEWAPTPHAPRPSDADWQTRTAEHADVVEYAANVEWLPWSTSPLEPRAIRAVLDRVRPAGRPVRPAVIVALDDEAENARIALALQEALFTRGVATVQGAPATPLFAYLYREEGLARQLAEGREWLPLALPEGAAEDDPREVRRERLFPLHVFGQRAWTASYTEIVDEATERAAVANARVYRALGGPSPYSALFDRSNREAAWLARRTLGRMFGKTTVEAGCLADYRPTQGWASLKYGDPADGHRVLERMWRAYTTPTAPRQEDAAATCADRRMFERWTFLLNDDFLKDLQERGLVPRSPSKAALTSGDPDVRRAAEVATATIDHAEAVRDRAVQAVLATFECDLAEQGGPDAFRRLGEMEHNRWMAERLTDGWRYGARSDDGRRRGSIRSWHGLSDATQLFDMGLLPRLILEAQENEGVGYQLESGWWGCHP